MKEFEILFRRLLLSILLFVRRAPRQRQLPKFTEESKILFIRLNRIGDALVSTPLLKEIKTKIGCNIYVLASKSNYFIFENRQLSDEIIIYRKNLKGISALIKMINELKFDAIVDLHDDVSSTVSYIMAFSKSIYKFGLKKENSKIYTHTVDKIDSSKFHVVDRMLEFLKLFGLRTDHSKINIVYSYSKEAEGKANFFLEKHIPEKKFLIGINISAGSEARFWGIQNFKNLIADLTDYDLNILLMCAENDLTKAVEISGRKIPIFYRPIFDEFCAMIDQLDLLFTPDTSIVHIASAFDIPVFGLYVKYNTNNKIWSPYKSRFNCIITEEPTLHNVKYEEVKQKFIPFFKDIYHERAN